MESDGVKKLTNLVQKAVAVVVLDGKNLGLRERFEMTVELNFEDCLLVKLR